MHAQAQGKQRPGHGRLKKARYAERKAQVVTQAKRKMQVRMQAKMIAKHQTEWRPYEADKLET